MSTASIRTVSRREAIAHIMLLFYANRTYATGTGDRSYYIILPFYVKLIDIR
ncbi:hypothetical protein H6F32_05315 [Anabaena sp. FACHB-1237]|uniref:hypothetical protein n=1 Tax=Anabaena sp. FACHB-1237 TaxID=2692769 RepID=UPI00168143FB|nr:hypothetical protein [Anabaena sp. FACHB-1237]MBD2137016.1 hypothetical protein [Anabaena sp. FACHB-1237]